MVVGSGTGVVAVRTKSPMKLTKIFLFRIPTFAFPLLLLLLMLVLLLAEYPLLLATHLFLLLDTELLRVEMGVREMRSVRGRSGRRLGNLPLLLLGVVGLAYRRVRVGRRT